MANQSKLSDNKESNKNCSRDEPPIPLKAEVKNYKKEECVVIQCRSNLTDPNSITYNLSILIFKGRNLEEWLK